MGLGHGGMTWGMCRNGCPLRAMEGGDVTLDGDIFNRGTGVMTDGGEVEGNDNDDNDDDDDDDDEKDVDDDDDDDEGDLVDEIGGERGEKRSNDEEGEDDDDGDDDDDDDDDGEERDLLVERSTGSVCIWNRSDGNRFSGE